MRAMSRNEIPGRIPALALVVGLILPGCITEPDTADDNASNTYVVIQNMQGAEGEATTPTGADLFSDVCTGTDEGGCSIFNDNAIVEMSAFPKNEAALTSLFKNDVVFERYRVTYIRSDGRNVPGVDVPYPFDGVANFVVPLGETVTRPFIVVRHQAKVESPLAELSASESPPGGAVILSTIAQIDFYGRDVTGRAVQVTGYLNVVFADFADEE